MKRFAKSLLLSATMCAMCATATAQDPNFHIYLCIGQSNMEGNALIEPQDRADVPERFKVMATAKYNEPQREIGEWYTAVPPLVRENTGLTPMDYFGRTMVANLPEEVTIGVVPVAVGGCKIEHLDKDYDPSTVVKEANWFQSFMAQYDNRPYDRLIECAKKAQKQGVIKGILLHQGESNTGDREWPAKVNKVYRDILADLGLKAADVPIIAGEVVATPEGGVCGSMNAIIDSLPETIPTARVVSAASLPQKGDGLHFTPNAYRVLGCRYAIEMLDLMCIANPKVEYTQDDTKLPDPVPSEGDYIFDMKSFNPSLKGEGTYDASDNAFVPGRFGLGGWKFDQPIDLSGYKYIVAVLGEPDSNGIEFRVSDSQDVDAVPYAGRFNGGSVIVAELSGMMKNLETGIQALNTSKVYNVGFRAMGGRPMHIKHVFATNKDPYASTAK